MNTITSKHSALLEYFCGSKHNQEELAELTERLQCVPTKVERFRSGQFVAHQGDPIDSLVLLTKGLVRIEVVSPTGDRLYTNEHEAPFPLIASLLYSSEQRFANDIIAVKDCEIEYYDREIVEKLLGECPTFRRGFLTFRSNLIYGLSQQLQIFSIRKIKGKLAYFILQKMEPSGYFSLDMSVTSLAKYFRVTRSALSRVISELASDGAIYYTRGFGEVLDIKKLRDSI